MKKLMIAVAAAAMIGAVEADEVWGVYDFSASLKTTKAKEGKSYTQKVQLGYSAFDGAYWYEDTDVFSYSYDKKGEDEATDASDAKYGWYGDVLVITFDNKGVGKLNVSKLDNDAKAALADDLWDYSDLGMGEPDIYKGKAKWCANFSFKVPGQCYRVAGSQKIQATYVVGACCEGNGSEDDEDLCRFESTELLREEAEYADQAAYWRQFVRKSDIALPDLTTGLLLRFGGESYAKSTKVEFFGQIFNEEEDALPQFALAGQGCWKAKLLNNIAGLESISGNIVGLWYDPECEVCCGKNNLAAVFTYCDGCNLVDYNAWELPADDSCYAVHAFDADMDWYDDWYMSQGMTQLWGTAAYGTFSIKFDKKLTQKWLSEPFPVHE